LDLQVFLHNSIQVDNLNHQCLDNDLIHIHLKFKQILEVTNILHLIKNFLLLYLVKNILKVIVFKMLLWNQNKILNFKVLALLFLKHKNILMVKVNNRLLNKKSHYINPVDNLKMFKKLMDSNVQINIVISLILIFSFLNYYKFLIFMEIWLHFKFQAVNNILYFINFKLV